MSQDQKAMFDQNKEQPEEKKAPAKTNESKAPAKLSISDVVGKAQASFNKANEYNMNFAREANFAVQAFTANPYMMKCDPISIKNAVVNVSLTGLSLNPAMKLAYLVPRMVNKKLVCCLDVSYMGMIKILTDAGAIKYVDADVIYENDDYHFTKGSEPTLKHTPKLTDRGEKIAAYAVAYFRDGGSQFIIMTKEEIEKVRNTSESYKNEKMRKYSPWETWTEEMWKKTTLKRLFKILPKTKFSDQLIAAISVEHENETNDLSQEDRHAHMFDDFDDAEEVNE